MTIAEKLASIKASKEAIKQAIEAKGVACGEVLSEYPEKIAAIPTGGVDMTYVSNFSEWKFTTEQFIEMNTYNWNKLNKIKNIFSYCTNLTTIPLLDTSNVTDMSYMFTSCTNLTTIPMLDASNVTDMSYMFTSCTNLTTIPMLDASNVISADRIFYNCKSLTNLGGFENLAVSLDLHYSPLLTVESLMNVINNLKDLTGGTAQTLTLGATNLAKLTDEQKAVATNKNWVLA